MLQTAPTTRHIPVMASLPMSMSGSTEGWIVDSVRISGLRSYLFTIRISWMSRNLTR